MKYLKVENFNSDFKMVTLNRPEVKNAFNPEMISEITQTFKSLNLDKKIKAIFFRGEGSVFCAGADLNWMKEMAKYTYEENIKDSENLWDMFEAIAKCETPVIGIVQGAVYGGALGLVACCDSVWSEKEVKFCFSEVKLGLAPAVISSFVIRKIADTFVRPLMLSAQVFDSENALKIGLIHEIFNGSVQMDEIVKIYSQNGSEAMRETKKLLNALSDAPTRREHIALTTQVISERRVSTEAQDRLKKYLNKN